MVVEALVFGGPVVVVMLGVPIWHSIGECRKGRTVQLRLLRWWLICGFIVFVSLLFGLAFGVAGFVLSNLPTPPSPSKASQISTDCRILSSGIDLRSAKICTPRLLSNARDTVVMRSKFRCCFEYYWASVFKVEFKPFLSEMPVQAAAEVPQEALPAHCRPGFGPAWTLKEKYQVNRTYPCKYTPGSLETVDIAEEFFAHCKSEKVTVLKLIKQAWIVLFFSEQWIFSTSSQAGLVFWKALSSISVAACYSVLVTGLAKTVCELRFMLFGSNHFSGVEKVYFEARLQITCIFVATLVGAIWYSGHLEGLNPHVNQLSAAAT